MLEAVDENQPKERREEVLGAARELFFSKGYRGTTIQQIAARAGYSKRTVYLDFRNKDELFMTLCAEGAEVLLGSLERIPIESQPIGECLDRCLEVFLHFSREHQPYFRMIFSEATPEIIGNCSPEARDGLAELERACLGVIVRLAERAVREGHIRAVDPWEVAGIFVGTATGIALLSMGGSQTVFSPETLESLVKTAIGTFWTGLRPDGADDATGGDR